MTLADLPYPDAEALADHWWWRPGWSVGTRFYAWHFLLDDQPDLVALVQRYQAAVSRFDELDPVPEPWLHITTQGIDHVRNVTADELDATVTAVRARLDQVHAEPSTFHRPVVHREGAVLVPSDPEPLRRARLAIRAGMADALGPARVPDADDGFMPHLSLAYANRSGSPAAIREAIDMVTPATPTAVTFRRATLIEMHRDQRTYQWRPLATVNLA